MSTWKNLPVEKSTLYTPPLDELSEVLSKGLKSNFVEVTVDVVDCPNLKQSPFSLAKSGLGGSPLLVEVGGPPYLLPTVQKDKIYEFRHIANLIDADPVLVLGAGAGPHPYAGVNCEGIFNLYIDNGEVDQHSRISKVNPEDESYCIQDILPNNETRFALLANLYFSEGLPGKVLRVNVRKRIGNDDFVTSMRKSLENYYKDKLVGLGGVFLLKEGKAKQHVMRDFSKTPINNDRELNDWLKFYNMSAPLIAVGTLINGDPGLDLRLQHFHSFSQHNEGGHYHIDTTPDTVEYVGYFNVAEMIYRIDKPVNTHTFGRD